MRAMQEGIVAKGGFEWHAFSTGAPINPIRPPLDTSAGRPFDNSPAGCSAYMRETACRPDSLLQNAALFYGLTRNPDCKLLRSLAMMRFCHSVRSCVRASKIFSLPRD
jgi:hypothetical protein